MNIPVFLSSDNNYAPFVATTIASICDNTESFIDFYILDGGITPENREKIESLKNRFKNFSIEFIKINLEKEFASIEYKNSAKHVSLSTYNRFLIPKLKPELKKILYLDVDVIAVGDIFKLYCENMENHILAAVAQIEACRADSKERKNALNLPECHNYFNAGVLLIDVEKWTREDITTKLFKTEEKYRDKLKWADQDVLNKVFDNNYKELAYCYNYMTSDINIKSDIILRHYNTNIKPWDINPNLNTDVIKHTDVFWQYLKITAFFDEVLSSVKFQTQDSLRAIKVYRLLSKRSKPCTL